MSDGSGALSAILAGSLLLLMSGSALRSGILKRRRRILGTPTSRVAVASGSGVVELEGTIAASEHGLLVAPFSGRECVWFEATVEEWDGKTHGSADPEDSWAVRLREMDAREFVIVDAAGGNARVLPTGASFLVDERIVAKSSEADLSIPRALEAFLEERGFKRQADTVGPTADIRFKERVLGRGERVFALGPSARPPTSDAYRTGASTQLVLERQPGPDGELLVSNKPKEEVASGLLRELWLFAAMFAVGLALVVAGVWSAAK